MNIVKKDILQHLRHLLTNRKAGKLPQFKPAVIPYRQEGSKYAEDTIRITGSRDFIDAVLARVSEEILPYESPNTRLQISLQESTDRKTTAKTGSWVCYIQFHQRGEEAKMANAFVSGITGKPTIISSNY
jgi:hypothetical protein